MEESKARSSANNKGFTALVYPSSSGKFENDRRQNAPLPEINAHMEWFDCLPLTQTQTSGWQ